MITKSRGARQDCQLTKHLDYSNNSRNLKADRSELGRGLKLLEARLAGKD
jgi:hypothetical protein